MESRCRKTEKRHSDPNYIFCRKLKLMIKRVWQWIVRLQHWLAEAKAIFLCLLVILAAIFFGFVTWSSETSIKSAGYGLQIIGMIFAIRGLLSIRAHFDQPLLRTIFIDWLKRFPKWRQDVAIDVGTAEMTAAGMKARGEVWAPDNPENSIEKRVEALVKNLDRVRKDQREQSEHIDNLQDSHEKHKKEVAAQSKKIEEDIRSDLESLHTKDIVVSLVGLVWLTVGISLSTMAPELYLWLR